MKKSKLLITTLIAACAAIPVLSGCGEKKEDPIEFTFSIDIETGKNELEIGARDKIVVYESADPNDKTERNYSYASSNPSVASINEYGVITAVAEGEVNFQVTEQSSGEVTKLVNPIKVVQATYPATGGFNYAAQAGEAALATRTEILSKLEKYAMDTHLTGITLFDNGGFVKYNSRVKLPARNYITGYGFGLLREGYLDGELPSETTPAFKNYYHTAISQDSMTINAMNASGSQVSDLSSYITSAYWGTKMADNKTEYVWYPILAKDSIKKPIIDETGKITGYATEATANNRPVALEAKNDLGLYKKWRIYLRDGLKYSYLGKADAGLPEAQKFNGKAIALKDYEFVYQFLLTGKNGQSRGAEMAGDTTYGIKGAQNFYNATLNDSTSQETVDNLWKSMQDQDELGIHTGSDENGNYIDLELVNAIDEFTAMYTLSSSLVSPLPREFMELIGNGSVFDAAKTYYGNFANGDIIDHTICVGPYSLETWTKKQLITFKRNEAWFEVNDTDTYRIKGIYNRVIDTSQDIEAVWNHFTKGELDVAGVPTTKIETESQDALKTKGDSTFKLNVNSCTQEEWNELFAKGGKINPDGSKWDVKPWMSNNNFLNGLFFSINRAEFARKRGVQPSINYFSDAYLSNPEKGESYNDTKAHKDAVAAYHTVKYNDLGEETYNDYGYNYDKAVNSFKAAVNQLAQQGKLVKGSKDKPTEIKIDIAWMYPTDPAEYGEDIKSYFETAFNDQAVSGGTVKLVVENSYVTNWEDVYNERMMKGQFDLGFGAISGNTYNPLNFLEVLKSDNSSGFTLNWGTDTSKVDSVHPINYNGKKWSFDGLWEVADHGGIVQEGTKVKPVSTCYQTTPHQIISGAVTGKEVNDLSGIDKNNSAIDPNYDGYQIEIPLEFVSAPGVELEFSKLKIYASGIGYQLIDDVTYDKTRKVIIANVSKALCTKIDTGMFNALYKDKEIDFTKDENKWMQHPFRQDKYNTLWDYEVYYKMTLAGGQPSENSVAAKINKQAKDN